MASTYRSPYAAYPEYYGGYPLDYYGSYGSYEASYRDPIPKKRKLMGGSVCIDHIRGVCAKGHKCEQLHVDHIPDLDDRDELAKTKFCHDFQNRGECARLTCRFLHVTRSEEDEFLLTGNIARSIFERSRDRAQAINDSNYSSFNDSKPLPLRSMMSRGGGAGGYYSAYDQYGGPGGASDYDYYGGAGSGYPSRFSNEPPPRKRKSDFGGGGGRRESFGFGQPVTVSNYCIDFLKGNCAKGKDCRLDHVEIIQDKSDREAIVKNIFCHDFLNKRCPRTYCKYIHAVFDEQKFFLERGFFSESLSARNKSKLFFCDICIDHLKSQCMRGSSCQHRHVDRVETKDERICLSRSIFCHDFQEGICNRAICKLYHTGKGDEELFIETGCLPEHLRNKASGAEPSVAQLAETVCRDFLKGVCHRGVSCKYYHPTKEEARRITTYHRAKRAGALSRPGTDMPLQQQQQPPTTTTTTTTSTEPGIDPVEYSKLKKANEELMQRVNQLENLLADACHCITVAVGDQNPAIQTLLQAISGASGTTGSSTNTSQPN